MFKVYTIVFCIGLLGVSCNRRVTLTGNWRMTHFSIYLPSLPYNYKDTFRLDLTDTAIVNRMLREKLIYPPPDNEIFKLAENTFIHLYKDSTFESYDLGFLSRGVPGLTTGAELSGEWRIDEQKNLRMVILRTPRGEETNNLTEGVYKVYKLTRDSLILRSPDSEMETSPKSFIEAIFVKR